MKKVAVLTVVKAMVAFAIGWFFHGPLLHVLSPAGLLVGIVMMVLVAFGPEFARSYGFIYVMTLLNGVTLVTASIDKFKGMDTIKLAVEVVYIHFYLGLIGFILIAASAFLLLNRAWFENLKKEGKGA